jgi:restriction system protein
MARRNSHRRRAKALDKLFEKGISVLVLGAAMLFLPQFLPNPALRAALEHGLRVPAWFALVAGAVLIASHVIVRRVSQQHDAPRHEPGWTHSQPSELARRAHSGFAATETPPISRFAPHGATAAADGAAHEPTRETAWSARVFEQIEWRRFEAVCEQLFAQAGFEARAQSHGPDGGVDIWLHSQHADGPAAVVQCKHWTGKIGVKQVREFLGVMASHKLQRGTYATTSTFTADAAQFARENGISALDGERLLALIATRTAQQQAQLLAVAYEGDYWKPTCASCGVKMVERSSRGGSRFWGCRDFPKCRSMLPMRQAPA